VLTPFSPLIPTSTEVNVFGIHWSIIDLHLTRHSGLFYQDCAKTNFDAYLPWKIEAHGINQIIVMNIPESIFILIAQHSMLREEY
jgi:hypothetical protein